MGEIYLGGRGGVAGLGLGATSLLLLAEIG